jgi:hypothetical protein
MKLSSGRARHRPPGLIGPTALPGAEDGLLTQPISAGWPTP